MTLPDPGGDPGPDLDYDASIGVVQAIGRMYTQSPFAVPMWTMTVLAVLVLAYWAWRRYLRLW